MPDFIYINTMPLYEEAFSLLAYGVRIAVDTETYALLKGGSALDPHSGRISLLIAKTDDQPTYVFDILVLHNFGADFTKLVSWLDQAPYLLGQNMSFDLKFMRSTFGYEAENVRDTMIMAQLISNATGSKVGKMHGHGLGDLCREYLSIHITGKGTLQKSDWGVTGNRTLDNPDWLDKLTYAANDVAYLFPLYDLMEPIITLPMPHTQLTKTKNHDQWGLGMREVLDREFAFIPVKADMEYNGMPVSRATLIEFQGSISKELNITALYLCKELSLGEPIYDWNGDPTPPAVSMKTLRSSAGLLDLVKKALGLQKIDNTQAETLARMLQIIEALSANVAGEEDAASEGVFTSDDEAELYGELLDWEHSVLVQSSPLVSAILKFKKLMKQESMDLTKYINKFTGRIHCGFKQIGTATSRLSSSGPNTQQISGRVTALCEMDDSIAWKTGELVYE